MFARLVEASLRHRLSVLVLALLLVLLGARSAQQLPVDVLPELTRPMVSVQAEAPGLATDEVESLLVVPLEAALAGLPQLGRLRSQSTPGLAVLYLEFDWGSEPYRNRQLVAERLDSVRAALAPLATVRIGPLTSLMGEVLQVAYHPAAGQAWEPERLRAFVDWRVRPQLLAVPGVAQALAIGGAVKQYEIRPDPARLQLLGISVEQIERAVQGWGRNAGAGFLAAGDQELALRSTARGAHFDSLAQLALDWREGAQGQGAIRLGQVAELAAGSRWPRGEAGYNGGPAVILSVQKQPGVDSVQLTQALEAALAKLDAEIPPGNERSAVFRQAGFIEESLLNLREALLLGALIVAAVLLAFLRSTRVALIALLAIPVSMLVAILVLRGFDLSINTMTLGGLAIAVGELVDDAVVGVENLLRRLRDNAMRAPPEPLHEVVLQATVEVRSGILQASLLIVLVFLPLFALGGIEGRLFLPLGLAYISAILASLLVAVSLTPVLGERLLAGRAPPELGERVWLQRLKLRYTRTLQALLRTPPRSLGWLALPLLAATVAGWQLPRSFLPAFNERTLTVNLLLEPGVSLEQSGRIATAAERLALAIPEVASVGRRTGRAEEDEHAEGLHYSELEISLKPGGRPLADVRAQLRGQLSALPAQLAFGQPISHRLDHLLSGVRAPLVVKLYGEDLAPLRTLAEQVAATLRGIPGLAEVQSERLAELPQLDWQPDARRAVVYGVSPPRLQDWLRGLVLGRPLSLLAEGERRTELVLRLPADALAPERLGELLVDTPAGAVPLSWLGELRRGEGPGQILREDRRRRVAVFAFHGKGSFDRAVAEAERQLAALPLPPGVDLRIEGEIAAQREATQQIADLSLISLLLMAAVLYGRYRSLRLSAIVLASLPFAFAGGVAALALSGTPLSVASLVGFVTLAGIAARNGILKLSHYLNLHRREQLPFDDALVLRGSAERLTPVLMTASIAALALLPLLFDAAAPGKEILHPVAVVIFGGLLVGTAVDSFLTPWLFRRYGDRAVLRLAQHDSGDAV